MASSEFSQELKDALAIADKTSLEFQKALAKFAFRNPDIKIDRENKADE